MGSMIDLSMMECRRRVMVRRRAMQATFLAVTLLQVSAVGDGVGFEVGVLAEVQARASDGIRVVSARIGCLEVQKLGNLTRLVARRCNGKQTCRFKAPTPRAYGRMGITVMTRANCAQAMDIRYRCARGEVKSVLVRGDAWKNAPAELSCPAQVTRPVRVARAQPARTVPA